MNCFVRAGLIALSAGWLGAAAATDVGVSIRIGDPNFYGRIDIGSGGARPVLLYPDPVVIAPSSGRYAPVYLRVPPGHAKDWKKHCRKYDACGRPVYFVKDDWYRDVYVPEWQEKHGKGHGKKDEYSGKGQGKHDEHPGKGHGRGKGHD